MKSRFIVLLPLLIVLRCGLTSHQIKQTETFGAATEKIGKLGEEEFVSIRNSIIQMNSELIAIDNTKSPSDLKLDRPTSIEATSTRVAACKALKLYGELLVKLVSSEKTEDLQSAAHAFSDNITLALKTELTDDQKGAISTLIAGFGSLFIERKKANAVKKIIPAYTQQVDTLAKLLLIDFSVDGDDLGYLKALDTTARRLKNAAIKLINAGDAYSVYERDRAVKAYVMAEEALIRTETLNTSAVSAINGLRKANQELARVIQEDHYESEEIKKYAENICELINAYQVLSK